MSPYSQIILSLALTTIFTLLPSSTSNTQLIIDTCKKITQAEPSLGGNYELCVEFLQSDSRSETATLEGLAEISFELTRKRNVAIQSWIKVLQRSSRFDAFVKKGLEDCAEMYSEAESSLGEALNAFKKKDYFVANTHVSEAEDAASDCEDGFKERKGETSPLTRANNDMYKLCGITLVFTNLFH